ncbi:unnamed protein product [Phaedon cochleariae]|uniref:DUF4371 domain-containing protein n=1 Tax=Phaedon cochleariae TaxID=80249 RepID=A0A9N9X2Y2_PHACE|nr:unnamed protein product [Phaedon cochleariae]
MDAGRRKGDRNIRTIDSYFMIPSKKSKQNPDSECSETVATTASDNIHNNQNCPVTSDATVVTINMPLTSKDKEKPEAKHQNDIGFHIGKNIDDFTKNVLLEKPWMPDDKYKYPYSLHPKGNGQMVKRYLSKEHIQKYNWLVYSDVKQDLTSKDGYIETHYRNEYHKECITAAKKFLRTYRQPQSEVVNLLSSQRMRQVEENRARLRPIIESILFLGRQNISLRGHRDDGNLLSDEQSEISNEGNFRALLNFRIQSGDKVLESHLKNTSSRATYISKTTQNILINCCGQEVTTRLIEKIKKARYWSIIFDETTDLAHIEQIVIVVRYLDEDKVREDFIKFIDAYDSLHNNTGSAGADADHGTREYKLTGKNLADIVSKSLADLGLNLEYCIGIGTDGCSVMTSEKKGAVSEFQKIASNANRVSCYNHALNNAISQSSKIQSIRNTVGVVKEVISFFNQSAKRNSVLKSVVGKQLMSLCETRWVERHDSFIIFSEALPKVIKALEEISHWNDNNSSKSAIQRVSNVWDTMAQLQSTRENKEREDELSDSELLECTQSSQSELDLSVLEDSEEQNIQPSCSTP